MARLVPLHLLDAFRNLTPGAYTMLPPEEKVGMIIAREDMTAMDIRGGYPSDWEIRDGILYRAFEDENGANLQIVPVQEFIDDNEAFFLEYLEKYGTR